MKKILIVLFVTLFSLCFSTVHAGSRSQGHSGRHQKYDTHTDEAGVKGRLGPIHFGVAVYAQHNRTANQVAVHQQRPARVRTSHVVTTVCTCEPVRVYCSGCSRDCNPHYHRRHVCSGTCGVVEVQADVVLQKRLYGEHHTDAVWRNGSRYPVWMGESHSHRHNHWGNRRPARGYYRR
jgi:hypothetical protein